MGHRFGHCGQKRTAHARRPAFGPTLVWVLAVGFVAATSLIPTRALADTWRLDPEQTEVRFSWDNLGVSRQSGEIRDVFGRLDFTPPTRRRAVSK